MDDAVQRYTGHDVDEKTMILLVFRLLVFLLQTYLVILSSEWKTMEFLHIAIAIALFPNARQ